VKHEIRQIWANFGAMEDFKSLLLKPWFVFSFSFILIGGTLILVSPNLFEGEIVYSQNGKKYVLEAPLSLAYFLGLGFQESEMEGVVDFHLIRRGYMLAASLLLGFPTLLAYRSFLAKKNK
jgi:hypothetical protein